ncbi:uncharacterized protein LOC132273043 [Cornus florida]|uniref:uncharacterized protein LOC132273043 n=1 Tax=Cornus florida TaxID=4283 RepID=UPI0028977B56|nr:uncharacterized protein LOC132273043 [Cornus florida]
MSSGNANETISPNSMPLLIPPRTNSQHGRTMRERLVEWRSILLLVLCLIATVTFQASINPPGGVWQDDSPKNLPGSSVPNPHKAGEFVMFYNNPVSFANFYIANLVGFIGSLLSILLLIVALALNNNLILWFLITTTCLTVVSVLLVVLASFSGMTPHKNIKEFNSQMSKIANVTAIGGLIIVCFLVILVSICILIGRRSRSLSSADANNANSGDPEAPQDAAALSSTANIGGPEAPQDAAAANNANIGAPEDPQNAAAVNNGNGGEIELM